MGESSQGLARVFVEDEKYRYGLQQPESATALAELILLERDDTLTEPVFERLVPVQAMQAMLDFTYQSWLVRAIGRTEHYFLLCGRALEGVRVTRMRRPWGFDAYGDKPRRAGRAPGDAALNGELLLAGDTGGVDRGIEQRTLPAQQHAVVDLQPGMGAHLAIRGAAHAIVHDAADSAAAAASHEQRVPAESRQTTAAHSGRP